ADTITLSGSRPSSSPGAGTQSRRRRRNARRASRVAMHQPAAASATSKGGLPSPVVYRVSLRPVRPFTERHSEGARYAPAILAASRAGESPVRLDAAVEEPAIGAQ